MPALGQQPLGAPTYDGDDWYSADPANGNLADPYGPPGGPVTRDPVRGYPPSPENYPGDGQQRFETDDYGSYSPAPYDSGSYETGSYDTGSYGPPGYGGGTGAYGGGGDGSNGSGYDDAYERAFAPGGYPGPGHPSGDYPVQYPDEFPGPDGGDTLASPAAPPRGPRRSAKSRPKKKSKLLSKTALLSITAGVVALAVGGTAFVLLSSSNSANNPASATGSTNQAAALPSASASTPVCDSKLGTYCHIETRSDDPTPLTLAEVFRAEFENTSTKEAFVEAGQRLDTDCGNALIGSNLQNAVNNGKCTQVLRASYVSGDGSIMGTVGVVNLDTTTAAAKAASAVDANDFLSPLTTTKGVTKKIGQGTGVVQVQYKGHYLILMFAEFTNMKAPANSTQNAELENFEKELVSGTINIALSNRMVTGAPVTASS
jgi:hypothetical protein